MRCESLVYVLGRVLVAWGPSVSRLGSVCGCVWCVWCVVCVCEKRGLGFMRFCLRVCASAKYFLRPRVDACVLMRTQISLKGRKIPSCKNPNFDFSEFDPEMIVDYDEWI